MRFSGDLRGRDFAGADLRGAVFRDADLYRARFAGGSLEGAVLDGCFAAETDFSGARCAGIRALRTSFYRACFRGAELQGAVFEACVLAQADLRGATLEKLTLTLDCHTFEEVQLDRVSSAKLAYLFGRAATPHRKRWINVIGERDWARLGRIFAR
jgi:uncharacterized protein YjbI with pentapeptide repeats